MITIDNPAEKIFERWGAAVEPIVGEGNCSMNNSQTVFHSDKYARIFLMGNPTVSGDIEGNECATTVSLQVDCFATGRKALTEVYKIDAASHQSLVDMGFRRTYGGEVMENIDSKIKRVTSRYSRLYAGKLLGEE